MPEIRDANTDANDIIIELVDPDFPDLCIPLRGGEAVAFIDSLPAHLQDYIRRELEEVGIDISHVQTYKGECYTSNINRTCQEVDTGEWKLDRSSGFTHSTGIYISVGKKKFAIEGLFNATLKHSTTCDDLPPANALNFREVKVRAEIPSDVITLIRQQVGNTMEIIIEVGDGDEITAITPDGTEYSLNGANGPTGITLQETEDGSYKYINSYRTDQQGKVEYFSWKETGEKPSETVVHGGFTRLKVPLAKLTQDKTARRELEPNQDIIQSYTTEVEPPLSSISCAVSGYETQQIGTPAVVTFILAGGAVVGIAWASGKAGKIRKGLVSLCGSALGKMDEAIEQKLEEALASRRGPAMRPMLRSDSTTVIVRKDGAYKDSRGPAGIGGRERKKRS